MLPWNLWTVVSSVIYGITVTPVAQRVTSEIVYPDACLPPAWALDIPHRHHDQRNKNELMLLFFLYVKESEGVIEFWKVLLDRCWKWLSRISERRLSRAAFWEMFNWWLLLCAVKYSSGFCLFALMQIICQKRTLACGCTLLHTADVQMYRPMCRTAGWNLYNGFLWLLWATS